MVLGLEGIEKGTNECITTNVKVASACAAFGDVCF